MSDLPELPTPVAFQYRHIYFLSNTPVWMTSEFYNGSYSKVSRGLYTEDQLRSYTITALAPLEAEIEDLKHDIAEYVKISSDMATEQVGLEAEIARLTEERDALAEDATRYRYRYRWLCDGVQNGTWSIGTRWRGLTEKSHENQ